MGEGRATVVHKPQLNEVFSTGPFGPLASRLHERCRGSDARAPGPHVDLSLAGGPRGPCRARAGRPRALLRGRVGRAPPARGRPLEFPCRKVGPGSLAISKADEERIVRTRESAGTRLPRSYYFILVTTPLVPSTSWFII